MSRADLFNARTAAAIQNGIRASQNAVASFLRNGATIKQAIEACAEVSAVIQCSLCQTGTQRVVMEPLDGEVGFVLHVTPDAGEMFDVTMKPVVLDGVAGVEIKREGQFQGCFSHPDTAIASLIELISRG